MFFSHAHPASENRKPYHYYTCHVRRDYKRGSCDQKHVRAEKVEAAVWSFVSGLSKEPEQLRAGVDALIQEELAGSGAPGREARILREKIVECVRLRVAYQDQQAAGLMALDELAIKPKEPEEAKRFAQAELANLSGRQQRAEELSQEKDALLEFC